MTPERGGGTALARTLALCVSGLLGVVAQVEAEGAQLSTWIWLSLWALPAGALAGSHLPRSLVALPLFVGLACAWLLGGELASPTSGALAVASLFALGLALHGPRGPLTWGVAAGLLFLAGTLSALPSGGGALAEPFPPATTAMLLDASPVVWVLESAGVDWMRHASIYEIAGAADIGPDLRVAHSGSTGPLLALVVAVVLVFVRERLVCPSSAAG